jgi:hypothetical protein
MRYFHYSDGIPAADISGDAGGLRDERRRQGKAMKHPGLVPSLS